MRVRLPGPLVVLVLSLSFACSGRSRGPAPPADPDALSLEPWTGPLDAAQRHHLLRRTCWGCAPADAARLDALGLDVFVDGLLAPGDEPAVAAEADRAIPYRDFPESAQLVAWWIHWMVHTEHPLRDVMAFFWHDHFATSAAAFDGTTRHLLLQQIEKLRALALGNARVLLRSMTADPAMQIWLDGVASAAEAPNENLARELFELFALGVDNGYTQADIAEAARALTGFRTRTDPLTRLTTVVFDPSRHDPGVKSVFGQSGRFDLVQLVDLTIDHRPYAEHLCRRLFEHFCYAPAPEHLVAELAAILRTHGYELRPVLAVLLRSRAFFSAAARHAHVKSPVETAVGFLRATGLAFPPGALDFFLSAAGQRPFWPPSVAGWPGGEAWLAANSVLQCRNLLHAIAVARSYQSGRGVPIEGLLPAGDRTPARVVATFAERLGIAPTPDDAAAYAAYLDTATTATGNEVELRHDPFRGDDPQHLSERVRGLLFLMSQHPSHLLR